MMSRNRWAGAGALGGLTLCIACALPEPSSPTADTMPSTPYADLGRGALKAGEVEYDEGRYGDALLLADSLFASWQNRALLSTLADSALWLAGRSLGAQGLLGRAADRYEQLTLRVAEGFLRIRAIERWVHVLADTGREREAVEVALENAGVLDGATLDVFRRWVSTLSAERLQVLASDSPPETSEAIIVHVHLAELLVAAGNADGGRRIAAEVLERNPVEPERALAKLIVSVATDPLGTPAKLGAILPMTGDLADIGELLREGIELAIESYERIHPDGFELELVILDDRSIPDGTAALVAELESEGVLAIIGPLRSGAFATAARARRNPRLPLISPTATEVQRPYAGAYTLYDVETRELDVAVDLAQWVVTELGLKRIGILDPISTTSRAVAAFEAAVVAAGGDVVVHESYDPTLTTFQKPIESIAVVEPDAVYTPAPTPPVVLSLAPQLFYYGLYKHIILGSEAWADPTVMRRLETFASDYTVVGLWVDQLSPGTPWERFVVEYEKKYRKTLRDNILPGLAYDAASLVITALEESQVPLPAALAAYLAGAPQVDGVTGFFELDPGKSTVHRRTQVRMLRNGQLELADRSELIEWLFYARVAPSPFAPRDTTARDTIPR